MDWEPKKEKKGLPLYDQIARHFEKQIMEGQLMPGGKLPPERNLAKRLGVNRTTVVRAYDVLRSTGLVNSVRGSGTVVCQRRLGVNPVRVTNWHDYANGGSFLPTLPILQKLNEARNHHELINLSSGELCREDYPVARIQQIMKESALDAPLGYPEPQGYEPLRIGISRLLKQQYKIHAEAKDILITAGSQQALLLITQCLLNPGDAIALEYPSYFYSLPLFHSAGLRMFGAPMDHEGIIPEELERLLNKKPIKMLFINPTYQNPTGITLSGQRRKTIISICESRRIPIVEDDPYSLLYFNSESAEISSLFSMSHNQSVIYIGSLSKTVAPGLRIGWMVAPETVLKRLKDAKDQMDHGTNIVTQMIAARFITSGIWEAHLKVLREKLRRRKNKMIHSLKAYSKDKLSWTTPKGGYHLWVKCPDHFSDVERLQSGIENGVLFVPGTIYGAHPRYVRLSYSGLKENEIAEGVKRFVSSVR
ncbi:PLP-dependent aminotransferase family protein [Sporolactobacillus pectinivorans]|uniref:MocR-like pyridoxine biosynthesis transcription factor PdxR n=1 Tax=Sporolactobacillus pectinivorans TaxID=1591408 RepID=UPI0013904A26|nr:PLP-dependent aminotransferase family protein [Sporolactobacillus pectinivorans]